MTTTPEGQVPRDEAFWRTYRAVQAEDEAAHRRADCLTAGQHELGARSGQTQCHHCGAGWGRLLADYTSWQRNRELSWPPKAGDVVRRDGDVTWWDGGPRVVKGDVVVGDDLSYRMVLHPPGHPLPTELHLGFTVSSAS